MMEKRFLECQQCGEVVQINKRIFGSWHFCCDDEPKISIDKVKNGVDVPKGVKTKLGVNTCRGIFALLLLLLMIIIIIGAVYTDRKIMKGSRDLEKWKQSQSATRR